MAKRRWWSKGRRRRRRKAGGRQITRPAMLLLALCAATLAMAVLMLGLAWFRSDWTSTGARRLTMEQARAANAAIPFVRGPLVPARPFRFHGTPATREQAVQCLATAALYEAGDDGPGQEAVIQVILNRVRLPAFPKTICGVVYQGSGLTTGCQFSFTCDGSFKRRPEHRGWGAARVAAKRALSGYVFAPVGTATHYHADWVVPAWISSLDKVAQVHSHIFYRRPG